MTLNDIKKTAKETIGPHCKVCPVCNGLACKGVIPGPGGKGTGLGFVRNYTDLRKIALRMDTIHSVISANTETSLFGKTFKIPVFAGPIGAVQMHYSDLYDDQSYSEALVKGCAEFGSVAFTGDGVEDDVFIGTAKAIKAYGGIGIPTIKPWRKNEVIEKIRIAEEAGAIAVAMDIDAAGLSILAAQGKPVAPMPTHILREVIESTELPFIVKGVMTVEGALKALEAGAYGILVSNHGGRVLDETESTVSVLPEIVEAVQGQMKVFVDGGFRSGLDVFKALAIGADGVIIARPFVTAVYGGGPEGVKVLLETYEKELKEAMLMTGASTVQEISMKHIKFV